MLVRLLVFLGTFLTVFLIYYLFVIRRKKYLDKFIKGKEVLYLKKVYKLKIKEDDYKKIAYIIALTNSFIISITIFIVSFFKYFFVQLLIGFVIVMVLIVVSYHIIGKTLKKTGGS